MFRLVRILGVACLVLACAASAASGLAAPGGAPQATNPEYAKLLTPADVQKVTGLQVKMVPYDPKSGAGGDLNFALASGELALMLKVMDAKLWDRSLQYRAKDVTGIGDKAYIGPPGPMQDLLAVMKGTKAFTLSSYMSTTDMSKTVLSVAQLQELAKIVVTRLQ
jgi:hypothetical protein